MDSNKLATALAGTIGKTIARYFLVEREARRYQLLLLFTDDTYYEFYGDGYLSGARCIDDGDAALVRERIGGEPLSVVEVTGRSSANAKA